MYVKQFRGSQTYTKAMYSIKLKTMNLDIICSNLMIKNITLLRIYLPLYSMRHLYMLKVKGRMWDMTEKTAANNQKYTIKTYTMK